MELVSGTICVVGLERRHEHVHDREEEEEAEEDDHRIAAHKAPVGPGDAGLRAGLGRALVASLSSCQRSLVS